MSHLWNNFFMNLFLFIIMYLMGFFFVFNSDDWFLVWMGLEINMMMFIIFMYKRMSILSVESCVKYFFIQSLGSAFFMVLFYLGIKNFMFWIMMLLIYKLGGGPFFFWFISVCSGISWFSCFLIFSIQKFIPLMLISMFISVEMLLFSVLSLLFGLLGSLNQVNLKLLMAYSSVFHLGWIFFCEVFNDFSWFIYLNMYMIMIFPVFYFLKNVGIEKMEFLMKYSYKVFMIVLIMSMMGMPPFLGFFMKFFMIEKIIKFSYLFSFFLLLSSVVMFYVYFQLIYDLSLMGSEMFFFMNLVKLKSYDKIMMFSLMGMIVGIFFCLMLLF